MGVGGEGFYGAGNPLVNANPEFPAQTWPQQTGQARLCYATMMLKQRLCTVLYCLSGGSKPRHYAGSAAY